MVSPEGREGAHASVLASLVPPRGLLPMFRNRSCRSCIAWCRADFPAKLPRLPDCRVRGLWLGAAVGPQLVALPNLRLGYCARRRSGRAHPWSSRLSWTRQEAFCAQLIRLRSSPRSTRSRRDVVGADVGLAKNRDCHDRRSCTGGYLAHRLTNVPGASAIFHAGYVTYARRS